MTKKDLQFIKIDLKNLEMMEESLDISYNICKKIPLKKIFTDEEYIDFDALTSRFSRVSDILVQKIFRTIDKINLEDTGTIRDRLNRAEKNGIISNIDEFIEIRKLRNDITHEYLPEELANIYKQVLKSIPILKQTIKKIKLYCKNKYKL